MKTKKLINEFAGLTVGTAVLSSVGNAGNVPSGVMNPMMGSMQLVGTGLYVGAAGNVLDNLRKLNKKGRMI